MTKVSLTVNGSVLSVEVEPRTHLADLLREKHNLTGAHIGCEHGVCGACTLLVDDVPIRSCITFAVACENAKVTTIEGLDEDEIAGALRGAFTAHHALQCGYCTPGMIVSARDIVLRMEAPSEEDIRVAMSGNLWPMHGLRRRRARDPGRHFRPAGARRRGHPRRRSRAFGAGRIGARQRNAHGRPRDGCRRRRSRGSASHRGGRKPAHRGRLEAASRVPAKFRDRPPGPKRYGPSLAALKMSRPVCPARRSMAARRTASSTAR